MLRVEMLPAENGDCLWVEYGEPPRVILIDGGTGATETVLRAKIADKIAGGEALHFELVVCTHIDNDHILGLLALLKTVPERVSFGRIWFNGRPQVQDTPGLLAVAEGEALSELLAQPALMARWHGEALVCPNSGQLPVFSLADRMCLTLLSPSPQKLQALRRKWSTVAAWSLRGVQEDSAPALLGVTPMPATHDELAALATTANTADTSETNGSSIAFLAEWNGRSCLFTGDAHPDLLTSSITRLCQERGLERLTVGALKVSHHGSKGNTSPELMRRIDCRNFLISTNGKQHSHPDVEAIARLIYFGGAGTVLHFNYESSFTRKWHAPSITGAPAFTCRYGNNGTLSVEIPA